MRGFIGLAFLAVFILVLFLGQAITLYTDLLWFREVDFVQVFTKTLSIKVLLGLVFGGLFFLLLYFNIRFAARLPKGVTFPQTQTQADLPSPEMLDPLIQRLLLPVTILLGFMAAPQAAAKWKTVLLYFNSVPFGFQDPLFDNDIGFYIFRLPAMEALYGWLQVTLALVTLASAFAYFLYRGVQYSEEGLFITERARTHLLILLASLLLVQTGGYLIDAYKLLYSSSGVVFGASYSDIYANLPALRLLAILSFVAAGLSLFQVYRPGFRYLFSGLGALFLVHVLGLYLYPSFLQRFQVVPNELVKETPYIKKNILLTRRGYGIDNVEEKEFPAEELLTASDIWRNETTVNNIRVWDHRPLLATYAQLQQLRTYYEFKDVDNDRYLIDGTYRQVMLSARELSHEQLPSRIWINEHLIFTHGYGVVFGPVNQVTREGLPEFFIKDIPPVSSGPIKVTRPEIYYGELANDYVFVKTQAKELDYPSGDQNIYTTYEGRGGVPLNSFWRKLLFSARFATLRISLSNDIISESRILYHREIQERVKKIAPFLTFDRDAYLVIDESGRLFWIIDAYTTSDRYPYSEPTRGMGNYIRNSVKAVVDAYNGGVSFYISDPKDPVVKAYTKVFPALFKPLEAMPEDLRAHIRYPQDLFNVQARIYATYHMQDPQVFYNKEDLLSIPQKAVSTQEPAQVAGPGPVPMRRREVEQDIDPYYIIMRLPGQKKEEFVLLLPFTPNKRDNMRSWLAARSDGANYGKLISLNFPKAKLVYGPKQINARIDQDANISQKLTLWGQSGSQVIRGSLLAIPIENSLLYVQPLYISAEEGSLPELKRVITAFGNRIAMEETLEQSLTRLFGSAAGSEEVQKGMATEPSGETPDLARRALEQFNRSVELLRQGNWSGFGEELKRLEELLKGMQKP
jgi:uncharacterized membrane protein (UPF0182 family)